MNKQPEALRLADELDSTCPYFNTKQAAAELRRLHQSEREGWRYADELEQERKRLNEVNQMLVEALDWIGRVYAMDYEYQEKANAALAKAKEQA